MYTVLHALTTVEPPNSGQVGACPFVLIRRLSFIGGFAKYIHCFLIAGNIDGVGANQNAHTVFLQ